MHSWILKCLLLSTVLLFGGLSVYAQELNCKVQINTEQISGTDKAVYENLKTTVQEYMNTTRFSNVQLSMPEKIDCSILFIFKSREANTHTCD